MKVLLYAQDFTGHPHVYCRVIASSLLRAGHQVLIAGPSPRADWPKRAPALKPLMEHPDIEAVDLKGAAPAGNPPLSAEALVALQTRHQIDCTLFMEADKWADEFRRIAGGDAPRLRGRNCGIFGHASQWIPGEDPYTGARPVNLRSVLGSCRRKLFNREDGLDYFYRHVLVKKRVLDAVLVKDARTARAVGAPVYWMPEIYKVFDPVEDEKKGADWFRWSEPIQDAVTRAGPDRTLLYFGTGAWYKGYDYFLALAERDPDILAVHAGAPDRKESGKPYAFDVDVVRAKLLREERLLETGSFVDSTDLVDLLFSSVSRFVSTHRLTLSSGTMLQALDAGKPVLTPDAGLVGYLTKEAGLGSVYSYGDVEGLVRSWSVFRTGAEDPPPENISRFMSQYSKASVEEFFAGIVLKNPGDEM